MNSKRKSSNELIVDFDIKKSRIQISSASIERSLNLILKRQEELYKKQTHIIKEIDNIKNITSKTLKKELNNVKKIIRNMVDREMEKKDEVIDKLKGDLDICNSRINNFEYENSFKDNNESYDYYS